MPEEWGIFKMIVPKAESRGDYFRNPLAMGVNKWKGRVEFFFSFLLMIPIPAQLSRFR
jgi:hypothetical protein